MVDVRHFWFVLITALFLSWGPLHTSAAEAMDNGNQNVSKPERVRTVGSLMETASPEALEAIDRLFEQVSERNRIKVIVKLRTMGDHRPLGHVSTAEMAFRQSTIANAQRDLLNSLAGEDIAHVKRFESIPYLAISVNESALDRLVNNPQVVHVQEDKRVPLALDSSVPLIDGDLAWTQGYTGKGQTVAILDSGVDKTHTFLSDKVVSEACYSTNSLADGATSLCPGGVEESTSVDSGVNCSDVDVCDHGTHVAGIAAGNSSNLKGVAYDANIIAIQVFSRFDDFGYCGIYFPCLSAYFSDIIKGLERVIALRDTYNIASVNMSLGGSTYTDYCDSDNSAMKAVIDNLASVGIATVIASGNEGERNAISVPACISSAVSVGSVTDLDDVSSFSNVASFLDILAPGSSITSSVPGDAYGSKSGTSMATPHVAGAWAVMKEKYPTATVSEILNALLLTGATIDDERSGGKVSGMKRVDLDDALNVLIEDILIAPSNLNATAVSVSQTDLSWQDNSDNENGFVIERKMNSNGTWEQIATVGLGTTTYSDTDFDENTPYYYRIAAYNDTGYSLYSNEAHNGVDHCISSIDSGETVNGQWESDCESTHGSVLFGSDLYAKYYAFTLPSDNTVTISLNFSDYNRLYLLSGSGRDGSVIASDFSSSTNNGYEAQIVKSLSAGTYTIEATPLLSGETGSFFLTLETADRVENCTYPIDSGEPVNGQWAGDCASTHRLDTYARYYTFTLASDDTVTISLSSSDYNFFYLLNGSGADGSVITSKAGGYAYTNNSYEAEIVQFLSAGTYTIEATTLLSGQTGSFSLTLQTADSGDNCTYSIALGETVSGSWASGCASTHRSGSYAEFYTFTLSSSGTVTISLTSSVDSYLYLLSSGDTNGEVIAYNDDYNGSTNSGIVHTLSPGTYTIEATTYFGGLAGDFDLTLE
jgi:subtilisin